MASMRHGPRTDMNLPSMSSSSPHSAQERGAGGATSNWVGSTWWWSEGEVMEEKIKTISVSDDYKCVFNIPCEDLDDNCNDYYTQKVESRTKLSKRYLIHRNKNTLTFI